MRKQEGFPGQISYVMPEKILNLTKQNLLISDLYFTDIGYYPQARHHFRKRESGSSEFILIYNIAGRGWIKVGKSKIELPDAHFFIIPPNISHSYFADTENPWSIYWIHFSGTKACCFNNYSLQLFSVEKTMTSRINERLNLFSEIFRNLERGYSTEVLEYTNLCLHYLLTSFTHLNQYRILKEEYEKDPVSLSINYMLENLDKKIKIGEFSEKVQLSSSHYARLFRTRTGHSPVDYFIQLKIQRACQLLDTTSKSIAEIALITGFKDPFYFSRQFKKAMNISPRGYRKR